MCLQSCWRNATISAGLDPLHGPSQDPDARVKESVLLAVAEEGLAALDVKAICARAQVSEARFRKRWPDAWAALAEALDDGVRIPEVPDTGNLEDDLVIYAQAYGYGGPKPALVKAMYYLFAIAKSDATTREKLGPGFAERRMRNLGMIRRAVARGELAAKADGNALLDALLSLGLTWNATGGVPPEPEVRRIVRGLIATAKRSDRTSPKPVRKAEKGDYRLYLFEGSPTQGVARVSERAPLEAKSEDAAIAQADARRGGRYAELWKGDGLIRIFDPDQA
jgi:hypothetical protein